MRADSTDAKDAASFQLKGGMITITALHVLDPDPERFAAQLAHKVNQNRNLFQGMPVVIDLQGVKERDAEVDVPRIALLLGDHGMLALGVRNGSEAQRRVALDFGLAVLPDAEPTRPARSAPRTAAAKATNPTKVVHQPIRSGQQIYAEGGDLIVLSSVSPGAEVLADGNIHVYGALHGRALAGVQGDGAARIFCRRLFAELISVAGIYRVYDDLDDAARGQAVQIFLDGEQLRTDAL